jgi:hypothetical protein
LNISSKAKAEAPASGGESEFERREIDRRASRIAIYDRLAEGRARSLERHRYYAKQVQRLVATLVLPGSRVLEVGCGLGDLIASLPGASGSSSQRSATPRSTSASPTSSGTPSRRARSTR